jgi:hypothetical protein
VCGPRAVPRLEPGADAEPRRAGKSGIAVADVMARAVEPMPGIICGDLRPPRRRGAAQPHAARRSATNPLSSGTPNYDFYTMEVVQRIGCRPPQRDRRGERMVGGRAQSARRGAVRRRGGRRRLRAANECGVAVPADHIARGLRERSVESRDELVHGTALTQPASTVSSSRSNPGSIVGSNSIAPNRSEVARGSCSAAK